MHETSGEPLDLAGPDPRARTLRWYLGHLQNGWRDVTEEELRRTYRSDDPVAPDQRIRLMRAFAANTSESRRWKRSRGPRTRPCCAFAMTTDVRGACA